jgi:hypothetical protein
MTTSKKLAAAGNGCELLFERTIIFLIKFNFKIELMS